jgi:hypothetical protein
MKPSMPMKPSIPAMLTLVAATLLALPALPARAADGALAGRWILNEPLTAEAQPEDPRQPSLLDNLPRTTVSVGGVPLPGSGGARLPTVSGSAPDPDVLRTRELVIAPAGDVLRLDYVGVGSETLQRGNDQGLVSRWSGRKLTTRYETTSRKVRQTYRVRRDGRLEVTVVLDPNEGPTLRHERIFERAADD